MDRKSVKALVDELEGRRARGPYESEAAFETKFVIPACRRAVKAPFKLYTHPAGNKAKELEWWSSKEWGAVHGWGTVQAFDILARHETSTRRSIAVEIKLAKAKFPTGDFQRMLGQCLLARLVHEAVIGVFGHTERLQMGAKDNTRRYVRKLRTEYNTWLVLKEIG